MKWTRTLPLVLAATLVACDSPDSVQPDLDGLDLTADARVNSAACRPNGQLANVTTGIITTRDCIFTRGVVDQYEDLYLVNPKKLGQPDRSGSTMLTFSGDASFNAIFGLGKLNPGTPDPVYAYNLFNAGEVETFGSRFSVVGSDVQYKLWFGGQGPSELGGYTLTTTVNPTRDTCESGHPVFVQGDVTFTSRIAEGISCNFVALFGDFAGAHINSHYWYTKVLPGESVELTLTGVTEPSTVLAAIDFQISKAVGDFGSGPGDSDRSVVFTNERPVERYIYLEVSTLDGKATPYTLRINGG